MKPWTALLTLSGVALTANAQAKVPNPFDDYERGVKLAEEPTADEAAPADEDSDEEKAYRIKQWTWSTGGGFQFAYTNTRNGTVAGSTESSETLITRLTPHGRVFVLDNVEVGLSMGIISKLADRENGRTSRETGFVMEAEGFYHYPIGEGFALVPGIGLGFYAGGSSRDLVLRTGVANESTSTAGFSGTLHLTAAYQPHPNWRVRSGFAIGVLAGSESVSSLDTSLSSTAVHITLPLEVSYVF